MDWWGPLSLSLSKLVDRTTWSCGDVWGLLRLRDKGELTGSQIRLKGTFVADDL